MNRDAAIAAGLLLALGIVVFVAMEDEAKAEPVGPTPPQPPGPGPFVEPGFPEPIGPIIADPVEPVGPIIATEVKLDPIIGVQQIPISALFVAGSICQVDAERYNAAQWPDPATVAAALTILGYPVSNTLTGDTNASQIMMFQLRARDLSLEGMQAAPDSFIDGVVGPCTLRALTEAAMIHNAGGWVAP
jgi:hypothetical protein